MHSPFHIIPNTDTASSSSSSSSDTRGQITTSRQHEGSDFVADVVEISDRRTTLSHSQSSPALPFSLGQQPRDVVSIHPIHDAIRIRDTNSVSVAPPPRATPPPLPPAPPPLPSASASDTCAPSVNASFINACWAYHMGERAAALDYTKDPVRTFNQLMGPFLIHSQAHGDGGADGLFEVTKAGSLAAQLEQCEAALVASSYSAGGVGVGVGAAPSIAADIRIRRTDLLPSPDGSVQGQYAFLIDLRSPHLHSAAKESIINAPDAFLGITAFLMSLADVDRQVAKLQHRQEQQTHSAYTTSIRWKKCQPIVINGEASPMRDLKAAALGRLVFITGTVMRMCTPKLACVGMHFVCGLCGHGVDVRQEGGAPLDVPKACVGRCRGFAFKPCYDKAVVEEVQCLKLQGNNQHPAAKAHANGNANITTTSTSTTNGKSVGRAGSNSPFGGQQQQQSAPEQQDDVSQSVDVELRGMLMEQAAPGDVVTVGGVVFARKGEKQYAGTHQICVRAASIVSHSFCKMSRGGGSQSVLQRMLAAHADLSGSSVAMAAGGELGSAASAASSPAAAGLASATAIASYYSGAQRSDWMERLVDSVSTGIYGHRTLKEAMVLSLVGGSERGDGDVSRPAIHLLMIGDPGLGKSQLLRAACLLSPRSAFVSAHTSSTCGLTVSLSRDASGETTFEAGAVVHGDGGITCIDELDKGVNEHKALLEVMEQQSISIAKAGMIFSMPIRTTVMAAGNPIAGKFDPYKTLAENINMSPALLSRFDIVYVMRDADSATPMLTRHILSVHVDKGGGGGAAAAPHSGGNAPPMSIPELARFLAFAKRQHQPQLTDEAAAVLKEAYLEQRRKNRSPAGGEMPITPRYLQSLIRLSEAYAKVYLRSSVTAEDARAAVSLHTRCSTFTSPNNNGKGAFAAQPMSKAAQKRLSMNDQILHRIREYLRENNTAVVPRSALLDFCSEAQAKNPANKLEELNQNGTIILASGTNGYRLVKM